MSLTDIAEGAASALIARVMKRVILIALVGAFGIVALYYASAAGTVALALAYGPIYAYMVMAGIYALGALIALTTFYATRTRAAVRQPIAAEPAGLLSQPRNMQIAMLIEAMMLGYSMARKSGNKGLI